MSQKEKCHFEIHLHEWYRDAKGRIWVVVGFWYENDKKDKVYLLQMGKRDHKILPYKQVTAEIEAKNMAIIIT